jgi:hypothetical protein
MQRKIWLLTLVGVLFLSHVAAWANDDFYVIAGGGTPVGTKITSVPCTISAPGFYFLGGNLTYAGQSDAITITADDVTLDLMGWSLTGKTNDPSNPPNCGIYMNGLSNVEIRNGTIKGFLTGIIETSDAKGWNHRIINIRANNQISIGISLYGKNHKVRGCTACNNNYGGIFMTSGTITDCVACDNAEYGIWLERDGSVIGCVATNNKGYNTTGNGFRLGTGNILVDRNCASGQGTNYSGGPTNASYWGVNAGR